MTPMSTPTLELLSLPDNITIHNKLTVGKRYEVLRTIGNGYVIAVDDNSDSAVILQSRFRT